jgi:hypothetical protein
MKRIAAVVAMAAAASLFAFAPANAEGPQLCLTYDINVNGTTQAGTQCLPA